MLLDFDCGNTRIKWRLSEEGGRVRAQGAWDGPLGNASLPPELVAVRSLERVRVASVAAPELGVELVTLCRSTWSVAPEFARTHAVQCGVVNGYQDPSRMGVDRWLAVLAAASRSPRRAVAVLDCGTTITLDLVRASGHHVGGYIVPGLRLFREGLNQHAHRLLVDRFALGDHRAGTNTAAAISNGVTCMLRGLVDGVDAQLGESPEWYVAGGDGRDVMEALRLPGRYCPDLVLDGLALAMP